jgi:hypothetical protein
MKPPRVLRSTHLAVLSCFACAGGHGPPSSLVTANSSQTVAPRPLPDQVFGVVLGKRFNPVAFTRQTCVRARAFAFRRGSYSIVTDDVLFGVPHEHEDTTAVLAALDSFTVCMGETRELNARAVVTLSDSVVGNAHFFWSIPSQAPAFDSLLRVLSETYGEPIQNRYGDRLWSNDSLELSLNHRGFYSDGASLTLSDARVCEHFERLVHREHAAPVYVDSLGNLDPRSNHCWVRREQ